MKHNVKIRIAGEDHSSKETPRPIVEEEYEGSVEFYRHPNDYGNGYGMYIKMKTEPFGGQGYDIRYDKEFHENDPISYIVKFFLRRYDGKDGAWKLLGIEVNEAEGERE